MKYPGGVAYCTEMSFCFEFSGFLSGLSVWGIWTLTPFWRRGVTTMKMIRRTRQTSTSGVTLMSLCSLSRRPPPPIPMEKLLRGELGARAAPFDEVVDELVRRIRHLDLEPLDVVHEDVEHPDGRDGDEEAERRRHERLGDAGRDRRDAARTGQGHAAERVDDADDRA